jgi:UDPglucose 6-dehydrogenase
MGYVGLSTAVCFAQAGIRVYGIEVDEKKRKMIEVGESPIHEKGIDSALARTVRAGSFTCGIDVSEAVENSDITFVTVGTPSNSGGEIDLSFIESATADLGYALKRKEGYHLVVVKSTVVPGTTNGLIKKVLEETSNKASPLDFGLCVNPEFLREGSAMEDTFKPDAIVIGAEDEKSSGALISLYKEFYGSVLPKMIVTGTENAEFVKYSINTFRATQLSFLNSLANLCERVPFADVLEVIRGLSAITRIDERYLKPGLGFGGSCLPKDVGALTALFREHGVNPVMLLAATEVNQKQPLRGLEIAKLLLGDLSGKKVSVLGLTFKAGTDDVRESVAIRLATSLAESGARVWVYDPRGMQNARPLLSGIAEFADSTLSCIREAECCIIATEWEEFGKISPTTFKQLMKKPIVIDGKRLLNGDSFRDEGVLVYSIGQHPKSSDRRALRAGPVATGRMRKSV